VLAFLGLSQHPASGETLKQSIETAVKTHPRVLAAEAQRRAARQDLAQAKGAYYPNLEANVAYGKERSDTPLVRAIQGRTITLDRREAGLLLTQNLFDGLATTSEVERQRARIDVASGRLSEVREEIALKAAEVYLEVLKNRHLFVLAQESLRVHLDTLEKVRLRVKGGVGQKADLQQALARVALARSTASARGGAQRQAEVNYRTVLGAAPGNLADPPPSTTYLSKSGEIDAQRLTQTITQATDTAAQTNPTLRAATAEVAAAEASVRGAKAPYYPRINLELSANRNRDIGGIAGDYNSEAALLVVHWNLFRGTADRAQVTAFAERRVAARDTAANTLRDVAEKIGVVLQAKATSEERLALLQEYVSMTVEVVESYRLQLDLGRRTLLDLLNAENELFTARSNLAVGKYEDILNQYAVEAAKGVLVKSLGIALAD
jgi:adhesin transport system outer membrane protein